MKRTTMIGLVLLAGLTFAVSAQGFGGHGPMMGYADDGEEVTYTGSIRLAENEFPVLAVGNEEYSLRINPALAGEIDIRNGARAEVTGWLRQFRSYDLVTDERVLHVTAIEIDGTRYVGTGGYRGMMGGMMHRNDSRRGMFDNRSPRDGRGNRW